MFKITWIPLRLNNFPIHHKQTQTILDKFLQTRDQVMQGDILGLQTIMHIQQKVDERIKEVDTFYQQNVIDPRTKHIFTVRTILKQLSEGCYEFKQDYERYTNQDYQSTIKSERQSKERLDREIYIQNDRNQLDGVTPKQHSDKFKQLQTKTPKKQQQKSTPLSITPMHMHKVNQSKNQQKNSFQGRQKQVRLSDLKKPTRKQRQKQQLIPIRSGKEQNPSNKKGSSKKVETGAIKPEQKMSQTLREVEKERRERASVLQQNNEVKQSFKDLSQLVFTIKMTKEEYNQFMLLKKRNNHA